jgi:hypothetical protein
MKRLLPILATILCGCAIVPRGPIVSHEVKRYQGRSDGLISYERWSDQAFTRGMYFFSDPTVSKLYGWHTNQAALGGSSYVTFGAVTIVTDTNLVPAIAATGTAAGNIIGAAVKTAVKP